MTKRRTPGPPRRFWSAADDQELRELYPDLLTIDVALRLNRTERAVYARAKLLRISKSKEFHRSGPSGRIRKGERRGSATQFQPGHASWNKGTNYTAGGRSPESRFKPGQIPHTQLPIGSEVWRPDGYLWRKVSDDQPLARHNWKQVHRLLWEEVNGAIPEGHAVVFINGHRSDIRIDNLELVSRADLGRRNSMHRYPPEIRQALHAKAALSRQINRLQKEVSQ